MDGITAFWAGKYVFFCGIQEVVILSHYTSKCSTYTLCVDITHRNIVHKILSEWGMKLCLKYRSNLLPGMDFEVVSENDYAKYAYGWFGLANTEGRWHFPIFISITNILMCNWSVCVKWWQYLSHTVNVIPTSQTVD